MATWKSAAYDGRYLQLDISESVNVVGNSSTLSWTLTSTGGASTYYTIDTTTVTINGTTVYSKERTYWDDRVFPAKKGSVSGTITVAHNSNGSKTIAVGFSTRVYIYGPQEYGGSMTLTTIDRSAPTVTFSTSNVTANGFKISATSSATADIWQYSTNGGSSWTQFSTTASTSASVTLSSLSPNTSYTVRVRARRQYNHVYGTSGSSTVKTLGGAVVNSVNTVTADNATVSITINVTVYEASYTNSLVLKNGSTTILTISGLSWSKGTANRTVTLTSAQRTTLLNAMASIKSFTGTFAVSSYSGSTQIGSTSSKTATVLTTATNSAPTISGFTYADSYTTTKNLTGNDQLFVQDYSTLKVTPRNGDCEERSVHFQLYRFLQRFIRIQFNWGCYHSRKDRQVRQCDGHALGHGLPRLHRRNFTDGDGHSVHQAENILDNAPENQRYRSGNAAQIQRFYFRCDR